MHKCSRCNHKWVVDYYQNVRLPGFDEDLTNINYFSKRLLIKYDLDAAHVVCPHCKRQTNLDSWEFVCENPEDNYQAVGFQVTPFMVPRVCPPGKIIRTSTEFSSKRRFVNDSLGLPSEDETTGLQPEEVAAAFYSDVRFSDNPISQIAGVDLGGTCATLTAQVSHDDHIRVMHAEMIPLSQIKDRVPRLFAENGVRVSLFDAQPYIDVVMQLQDKLPTAWASMFTESKSLDLFQIREKQEDVNKATFGLRQVNVRRNQGLDLVCNLVRMGKISFAPPVFHMKDTIVSHLTDMRRDTVRVIGDSGDEEARWRKSKNGTDHFMFALLYLVIASYLRGVSGHRPPLPCLAMKAKTKGEF
jgi:hypothetical protein